MLATAERTATEGRPGIEGIRPNRWRALAWPLGVLGLLIPAATAIFVLLNRGHIHDVLSANLVEILVPVPFAVIGTLLSFRRPANPIGWIFLAASITVSLPGLAGQYVSYSTHVHALPLTDWVAWTYGPVYFLVFPTGLILFSFLLFPDGHLPSRRWRWVAWLAVVATAAFVAVSMVQGTIHLTGSPAIRNPIGIASIPDPNGSNSFGESLYLFGLGLLMTAVVGTLLRTHRATGEVREQLRWLAFSATATVGGLLIVAFAYVLDPHLPGGIWLIPAILGFGVAIPVSCAIAILKYHLYGIDVVVSKTVVYTVLAAFFTVVYVAVVVGIGTAIGSTRNPFLLALAAALIALAFNPVRERAKHLANRLVYGQRATPYEVLSRFAERVADTESVDDVLPRMARILGEGTGARSASVWLRMGEELRPAATWGESVGDGHPIPAPTGDLPTVPGVSTAVPVRYQGELLGALAVRKPPNEPLSEAENTLVTDLAGQAGLVLRNVRLTEELRANLEELRASRQRIVAAQDSERKRLERNIHDGAQQQLVALAVKLRLMGTLVAHDQGRAQAMAEQLAHDTQDALENLRDLARGIYPPLLSDQGLVAALSAQARRSAIPVEVEAESVGRYPGEVEAAVYFCALEALQNVAKYANASSAVVRLGERDGGVVFEVADDGEGFDPTSKAQGTGLLGMRDRLEALGGQLMVASSPGSGTSVTGNLPVGGGSPRSDSP